MLTFLSVLAVLLGSPLPAHDVQPRVTARSVTPGLPEWRATPPPVPVVPLPTAPPAVAIRPPPLAAPPERALPRWVAPTRTPNLHALGRQQTDGG